MAMLFVGALVVNVGIVLLIRRHLGVSSLDADEQNYWNIATQLPRLGIAGAFPFRRTLPFPFLLALFRTLVGSDYLKVQLLVSALLAFTPVLVYRLVRRRIVHLQVARIAGVMVMLWPPFVRYGATLYSDSVGLLVFVIFLLSVPKPAVASERLGWGWLRWALAGMLLAFALQTKPLYLLYWPFAVILAVQSVRPLRRGVAAAAVLTLGCAILVTPWALYASRNVGQVVIVSTNGGETLAGGLNPVLMHMDKMGSFTTAGGRTTWLGPGKWLWPWDTGYLSKRELHLPYPAMSALLFKRARKWIFSHPAAVAYLSARKLLYMWGIYPFWNGPSQTFLGNIPLLLLLAAAACGLWVYRGAWRELTMFWTLPVFVSLVSLISWGSWRLRMPGDLGLIVLASMFGAVMLERAVGHGSGEMRDIEKRARPRIMPSMRRSSRASGRRDGSTGSERVDDGAENPGVRDGEVAADFVQLSELCHLGPAQNQHVARRGRDHQTIRGFGGRWRVENNEFEIAAPLAQRALECPAREQFEGIRR